MNQDGTRCRAYRYTWFQGSNSWTDMYDRVASIPCMYTVWQTERCPTTDRLHIQGYIYFKSAKTHKRMRHLLPGADIRTATKSPSINREYCTKLDTQVKELPHGETGILPSQGRREDLISMMEHIRDGWSDVQMFEHYPSSWAQHYRVMMKYRIDLIQPRTFQTKTFVLWGETGMGKSKFAFWYAKKRGSWATLLVPTNRDGMVWGDGTIGADVIIIEDHDGQINYNVLKRMLDRHPMNAPVKSSNMQWAPHYVIITSNVDPRFWYHNIDPSPWTPKTNALCRRLTTKGSEIVHITEEWHFPDDDSANSDSESENE